MKKLIAIVFASIMLLLCGCTKNETINYNYSLKGENEKWHIEYKAVGGSSSIYGEDVKETIILTYKGGLSELSSINNIKYYYEGFGIIGGTLGSGKSFSSKTLKIENNSRGGATERKIDTLEFKLTVDNEKTETIVLKEDIGL